MGFLTVRDKGMGQAGGGIVGPTFQLFQTSPIPGLSFPGGYGMGVSTPYRPPAQGGSGGPVQGTTYAPPTPAPTPQPTPQPPQYQPQPMPQPTQITVTTQQQPPQQPMYMPVYTGGGGGGAAPAPTPTPVITEEAMVPVILEEAKSDFPWWILLAIPAAMLAMKTKK